MLKIIQARPPQYMNHELQDVQAGLRKDRGTIDQMAKISGSQKKQESSRKTPTSTSLTMLKPFTAWITTNWKILQEIGIGDHLTCLLRNCMQVKKQQLELDMEQWTGSKVGKEYFKDVYCHPAYLTYM